MPEDDRASDSVAFAAALTPSPDRPLRILVADDDEINRAIVTHIILERSDIQLTLVEDGRRALELAQTQRFDLLIFDLNMPHINGDRLIRHLRASQSLNSTSPMILFTAAVDASGILSGNRASALVDIVLPKPIRAASFLDAVGRLTGR
ncbi:two-component system, chemotaxis family, response regulator CheY [Gemmobacter megaterium]|uniref:Two-component system, chemotaxis family, response regulator CheY n=1 Tax=Gemmobacter megaterium TaxID=1086013 RepID=A0A1N7M9Y7_9RHOB|nr:response regulator [Gemmobacter megaterium]GGE07980.1 hypothetical protein GCM10011345_12060 [Gemmobacter megaterium]SIS82904.1 two-component system, chemotaxis family, response regulator CheY [Gemmobacter megaterium]